MKFTVDGQVRDELIPATTMGPDAFEAFLAAVPLLVLAADSPVLFRVTCSLEKA